MGKKGFSAVEMIFTLVLVGALTGIGVVAYRNIQSRAEEAAHNKDQVVLQQVMESFRITGGNMAAILANTDLSADQQAAALTIVMQKGSTAETVKQTGRITSTIPADTVIVRYTGTDKDRLMPSPSEAPITLALVKAGQTTVSEDGAAAVTTPGPSDPVAFIVTKKTSILGAQAATASEAAVAAANTVLNPNVLGAHYAVGSQYLWNEDASSSSGSLPSSNDTNPGAGVVGVPGAVGLTVAAEFSPGVMGVGTGNYTYNEYQGSSPATVSYYVFRVDGKPLFAEDVNFGSIGLKVLMSNNTSTPQFSRPVSVKTVPASLAGGLGNKVQGLSFSATLKDLFAFGAYQPNAENLSYVIQVYANATETGKLGHPGIAPLQSAGMMNTRAITVTHPTKFKLAFAFDKSGIGNLNDPKDPTAGKGSLAAPVPNMINDPNAGDDLPMGQVPQIQSGTKIDYVYRYYRFNKPTNEDLPDVATAYVSVFRDDGTPVSIGELDDLVITYNNQDFSLKATDANFKLTPSTANLAASGAPAGSATFSFRLTPDIADPQADKTFTLALKSVTASAAGLKGAQGAGSIVGTSSTATDPVYVNVKKRAATLVVKRSSGDDWIRYADLNDYQNGPNKDVTMNITRSDGGLLAKTDVDISASRFVLNSLVAGASTNGVNSSKFTLGSTPLMSTTGIKVTKPVNNTVLTYALAPLLNTIALPTAWPKPQIQLQFYLYPSTAAIIGDKDKDPIQIPAASNSTFSTSSVNVGRVMLFADWLGAVPYNGPTSGNSGSQTAPGGGGTKTNGVGGN